MQLLRLKIHGKLIIAVGDLIPKVIKWTKTGFDVNKFYDLYPELKNEFIKFLKKDVQQ